MNPCELECGTVGQIPHTGDIGIVARGENREQLFGLCLEGLLGILSERSLVELAWVADENRLTHSTITRKISGQDLENVLVEFLTDVIYHLEVDAQLPLSSTFSFSNDGCAVIVTMDVVPYSPEIFGQINEVKAVTYHMLSIEECEGGGCGVRLILDI